MTTVPSHESWQLYLNNREILNSNDRPKHPGKWMTLELSKKELNATDTFHFRWSADVYYPTKDYLYLYLGKNARAKILVAAEQEDGSYHAKFAAGRLLHISDSLASNQLFFRYKIEEYRPPGIVKIKLKD